MERFLSMIMAKERISAVKRLSREPLVYVLCLTLLGAFFRLYHLGFKSLWLDEIVIYLNSLGDLSEILHKNAIRNSAPVTFTFIVHAFGYFGNSEFWLRLPSCLAGIFSIPMGFFAFKRYSGQWGAVGGCLLLAVSPMLVKYSQELREYSFVVFFTLALLYVLTLPIERKDARSYFIFGITAALAIQFQYGLAIVVAIFSAVLLVHGITNKNQLKYFFLMSLLPMTLSVLLVWYLSLKRQYQPGGFASASYLSTFYFTGTVTQIPAFFMANTDAVARFAFTEECRILLFTLAVVGFFYSLMKKDYLPLWLTVGLFAGTFVASLLSLYPYGGIRQAIFLPVLLYLVASVAFNYLHKKRAFLIIGVAVGIFSFYGTRDSLVYLHQESEENIKPVVAALQKNIRPQDHIFVSLGSEPAFMHYLNAFSDHLAFPLDFYNKQQRLDYELRAKAIAARPERTWLLFTHYQPKDLETMLAIVAQNREIQLVSPEKDYVKLYLVTHMNTETEQ